MLSKKNCTEKLNSQGRLYSRLLQQGSRQWQWGKKVRNARVWNRGGTIKVRERHMKEILQISSIINWMVREKGTR